MSITDELRHKVANYPFRDSRDFALFEVIADHIDIAHEHAIGYVDDRDPETMAQNGWAKLPVDANGEYIHIGDRVENNERVVRIVLTDGSWEPSVYTEKTPNVLQEYFCNEVSHYRKPTVEDLLFSYGQACIRTSNEAETDAEKQTMLARLREDYATKLRLAGDAE